MEVLFRVKFLGEGKKASKREPMFVMALGDWSPDCYGRGWFTSLDKTMIHITVAKNEGEVYNNTVWYKIEDETYTLQKAKDLFQTKAIEAFIKHKNLEIQTLEERKNKLIRDILYLSGLK